MCHTREGAVLAGGSGGGGKGALPRAGRGGRRHSLEVILGRFLGAIWEWAEESRVTRLTTQCGGFPEH